MKKALKVTAVLSIIYGIHYIALGIISLFTAGFSALVGIATFSLSLIGGTLGMIISLALCLAMAYLFGFSGIYVIKDNKSAAFKLSVITAAVTLLFFIITLISRRLPTSFGDVLSVILPIVQVCLIIKSEG